MRNEKPSKSFTKEIVVLVLLVLGAVYYFGYYRKQPSGSAISLPSLSSITSSIIEEKPPSEPLASPDSILSLLNDSTIFALSIEPRNFKVAADHLLQVRDKLRNTQVWKKLNLDEMLDPALLEMLAQQSIPGASEIPGGLPSLQDPTTQMGLKVLGALQEVSIALSSNTFSAGPDPAATFPTVHIGLSFSDAEVLEMIKQQATSFPLITPVDAAKGKYEYTMPQSPEIKGALRFVGNQIHATVGSTDMSKFLAGQNSKPISESNLYKEAQWAAQKDPLYVLFMDPTKFAPYFAALQAMGGMPPGPDSVLGKSWEGIQSFSTTLSIGHGTGVKGCQTSNPDSPSAKLVAAFKDDLSKERGPELNQFRKLIVPQTIAAIEFRRRLPELAFEQMSANIPLDAQSSEEMKKYFETLKKIQASLSKLPFDEIGILANAPVGAGMPDIGIYFGSAKEVSMTETAQGLNEILGVIGAESGIEPPKAQITKDPKGEEQIELNAPDSPPITITRLTANALYASMNPFTAQAVKQALTSTSADYLSTVSSENKQLVAELPYSDAYFYLNTVSLFEMGKPFLPFLLMQQPQLQLSDQDIDEVIKVLQFGILGYHRTRIGKPGQFCTEARAELL